MQKRIIATVEHKPDQMMEDFNVEYLSPHRGDSPKLEGFSKAPIIPLDFLIFYEVFGRPFGVEDSFHGCRSSISPSWLSGFSTYVEHL